MTVVARLLICALAVLATTATRTDAQDAQEAPPAAPSTPTVSAAPLRPGDLVRIRIWREPDLSGDFPVNESGIVVLPKLGEVSVVGRPASTLAQEIQASYAESIAHSSIAVVFLRRVQVIGAVRTPGLYHADPTMSMGDVIALAGGPNSQATINRVELYRDGRRLRGDLSSLTLVGESAIRSGDQIVVPQRSWISRNPGAILAGVGTSLAVIRLLVLHR
jgi:protein involved in polysaccharide export with SLBB domain